MGLVYPAARNSWREAMNGWHYFGLWLSIAVLLAGAIVIILACAAPGSDTAMPPSVGKWLDCDANVVCYLYGQGISCVMSVAAAEACDADQN
jgi:hypothetical protein